MTKKRGRTPSLWRRSVGERPDTVSVGEKRRGGPLYLRWTDIYGQEQWEPLGFRVRTDDGKADPDAERAAKQKAESKNLDLRLERLRGVTEPARLTVSEAWALFRDPERGAMPKSASARRLYENLGTRWESWLGGGTLWQRIPRKDVDAAVRRLVDRGEAPTAWHAVKLLRRLWRWLDTRAGFDGLRDPTKGVDVAGIVTEHRPHRPRFTAPQAAALVARRHDPKLDPRWALYVALIDDSGARGVTIRNLWRSHLDAPLDPAPAPELAPHGWVLFVGRKGQRTQPHFLTTFERREIDQALTTYLRVLEDGWREHGTDYPLFPGEEFPASGVFTPERAGSRKPVSYQTTKTWLHDAEEVAKIPPVKGRALHGLRRAWADYTRNEIGLDAATTAGGWSKRATLESIYLEAEKYADRAAAREAHERKRKGQ